jgi:hypothetical protein
MNHKRLNVLNIKNMAELERLYGIISVLSNDVNAIESEIERMAQKKCLFDNEQDKSVKQLIIKGKNSKLTREDVMRAASFAQICWLENSKIRQATIKLCAEIERVKAEKEIKIREHSVLQRRKLYLENKKRCKEALVVACKEVSYEVDIEERIAYNKAKSKFLRTNLSGNSL